MDRGAIHDGPLQLDNAMLLPFNDEPSFVHKVAEEMKSVESMEESYPGFPWTCYGPLDPGKTESLELRHEEAGTKGHRYLLCASYLPGYLVEQKTWGKYTLPQSLPRLPI